MRQNLTLSGRYRLDSLIGRGGMGEVWRATDLRLGRSVAVKLLPLDRVGDPQAMRRFEREAAAAASLRHRGIAVVFDTGADDESKLVFFVMELLEGEDLQHLLNRTPGGLSPERVREFGTQIASALAEAHSRGIVHRDVKPANVILMPDGELKICDFGVARFTDHSGSLTQGMIGTPLYMAPEQFGNETVDGRADLYSLGCLLYALAAGRPPFEPGSLPALLYQHMSTAPQPLTEIHPGFPADLAALIMRCLAKNPEDRPRSARELAEALPRTGMPGTLPSGPSAPAALTAPAVPVQGLPYGLPGGPVQHTTLSPAGPSPWSKLGQVAAIASAALITVAAAAVFVIDRIGEEDIQQYTPSPQDLSSELYSKPGTASRPIPDGWVAYDPAEHRGTDCTPSDTGYILDLDGKTGYVNFCAVSTAPVENVAIHATVALTDTQCASFSVRQQEQRSYELMLCAAGMGLVRKWTADGNLEVIQESKGNGPLQGSAHVTALAADDTLSLYLDGELLTQVKDADYRTGGIGLGVSLMEESTKDKIDFTDLTVWHAPAT